MAKRQNTKKPVETKSVHIPYELKLLLLLAFTVFYILSIYFNLGGLLGKVLREVSFGLNGFTGFFMPWILFLLILFSINPNFKFKRIKRILGVVMFYLSSLFLSGLIHYEQIHTLFTNFKPTSDSSLFLASYQSGQTFETSGALGNLIIYYLGRMMGPTGIAILFSLFVLLCFYFFTGITFGDIKENVQRVHEKNQEKRKKEAAEAVEVVQREPYKEPKIRNHTFEGQNYDQFLVPDEPKEKPVKKEKPKVKKEVPTEKPLPVIKDPVVEKVPEPTEEEKKEVEGEIEEGLKEKVEEYKKPSLNLLNVGKQPTEDREKARQIIMEKAKRLETILENFGVHAKVVEITRGPIINRYEIELEPGTKISKVVGLSDDLALNLAVSQVRVAPVPGKVAVGIEVPNNENVMVVIRDILASEEFQTNSSILKFGLGKDVSGKSVVVDLSKMPHLLIAGTTGSGKSVCVNTIITSILYNATPDEVKLLMIDPKVVELNTYNGIPHLILPVVTDPKKAAIALGWGVNEMTKRYESFGETGCKDLDSFNQKFPEEKLPRIVIIIDELSDLMMVAPNQVEDAITRIAQMGRAAGIHLIVATQRPSVDVITGLIKANIPSRIAFAVSSGIDSRTILDSVGAEKLLGKGDMLYLPIGANRPRRVQGAFISSDETEAIVDFIKNQGMETNYNEEILTKAVAKEEQDEFEDELLEDAIQLVIEMRNASASMLQRKFRIGYSRAGRLIDMMEERGIVGPPQGSKSRDVLVDSFDTEE
ncbi:FtsK/SpoIIIE family DNA translocase [Guggenheimella bovis]